MTETRLTPGLIDEDYGLALRRTRESLGMSQEDVAHAAGVAVSTYARLERDALNANPTVRTVLSVYGVLGVAVL